METYFLETVCFCWGPFLCCRRPWLKLGGINFNGKIFSCQWKPFSIFSKKKQFFRIVETYFSRNAPFRIVETDFLASANHKLFFRLVEIYFFKESFIPAIGEGFSFYWKLSTLLESYFLPAINVTDMSGNHFLKIDLILASGNSFSS